MSTAIGRAKILYFTVPALYYKHVCSQPRGISSKVKNKTGEVAGIFPFVNIREGTGRCDGGLTGEAPMMMQGQKAINRAFRKWQAAVIYWLLIGLLVCSCTVHRTPEPASQQSSPPRDAASRPSPSAVNTASAGPWDSDVLVFRLGADGKATRTGTFERAGVSSLARMPDGRLIAAYQYFPENDPPGFDKVAVSFSTDEGGSWTNARTISLKGLPEGMRFPFDPTLVALPEGRLRLYFTSRLERPAGENIPAIYSAISGDGINYEFESGTRLAIPGRFVIDCAVILHQGLFHLFAPDNGVQPVLSAVPGNGYHAVSTDGLNFTRMADVTIEGERRWLGCALSDGNNITFWGTSQNTGRSNPAGSQPEGGIWLASSPDGNKWTLNRSFPVPGADPGAVAARGGWIVTVTGAPRPGTASAQRLPGPLPSVPVATLISSLDGPSNHRVLLAFSSDGLVWKIADELVVEQASVPELFMGTEGLPVLIFVDASGQSRPGGLGAVGKQPDGSWVRKTTNLFGADPNIVILKDATYRAFTKNRDGSILVFNSKNGLDWQPSVTAFQDERYREATDPDVFETPDGWVMLVSLGPRLLRCTSPDGLRFTADRIIELGGSVCDSVAVPGGWRTYFHVNPSPQTGSKMVIRSAFTADGLNWTVEKGDRLNAPASGPAERGVADPAPLKINDGLWMMAFKSFIK
jgi:hypothetical protein